MDKGQALPDEGAPAQKAQNGPQGNAARVVDAWYGDVCVNLGPLVTTDVFNRLAIAKDTLKASLDAALA